MKVPIEKRIRALELYLRNDGSYTAFTVKWDILYNGEQCPNRKFMERLLRKFKTYGSLENTKSKRNRPCRNENTVTDISAYFERHKGCSLRQFFENESMDISMSTLRNILKDELGLKAYKCRKFHRLHGQVDYNARYNMCKLFTAFFAFSFIAFSFIAFHR